MILFINKCVSYYMATVPTISPVEMVMAEIIYTENEMFIESVGDI